MTHALCFLGIRQTGETDQIKSFSMICWRNALQVSRFFDIFSKRSVLEFQFDTSTCEHCLDFTFVFLHKWGMVQWINCHEVKNSMSTCTTFKINSVHMCLCHTKIVAHFVQKKVQHLCLGHRAQSFALVRFINWSIFFFAAWRSRYYLLEDLTIMKFCDRLNF